MAKDFLLDEDDDLKVVNGDLVIGLSDDQHVQILASISAGEIKQFPTAGMGLNRFLNSIENRANAKMKHIINVQLEADGAIEKKIEIKNGELKINASY
jgi:hypothetical protein